MLLLHKNKALAAITKIILQHMVRYLYFSHRAQQAWYVMLENKSQLLKMNSTTFPSKSP